MTGGVQEGARAGPGQPVLEWHQEEHGREQRECRATGNRVWRAELEGPSRESRQTQALAGEASTRDLAVGGEGSWALEVKDMLLSGQDGIWVASGA